MMRQLAAMLCFASVMCVSTPSRAQETTTYTYDTLGRLTGSTISDGTQVSTSFDPAGNRTNYSVNITPPASPSFSISAPSVVTEGNALVFTVTKTSSNAAAVSVNYATANGTATAGTDYTAASGTLTFAPAETVKTISVATTDDSAVESSETVLVNLSGATGGATIAAAQATGTINDNDAATGVSLPSVRLRWSRKVMRSYSR
jgi:YD repeat-containing protein